LCFGHQKVADALYYLRFVIFPRGDIAGPSKCDGSAIAGLASKNLCNLRRIISGGAFDRLAISSKPTIFKLDYRHDSKPFG